MATTSRLSPFVHGQIAASHREGYSLRGIMDNVQEDDGGVLTLNAVQSSVSNLLYKRNWRLCVSFFDMY